MGDPKLYVLINPVTWVAVWRSGSSAVMVARSGDSLDVGVVEAETHILSFCEVSLYTYPLRSNVLMWCIGKSPAD